MKRILIIVAVLLTLLSGCANNTVQPPTETETVNDSTTDTFPQVEKETTSSQAVSQESSVNIDSLEESTQDTDESKTVQTEASSPKQTVPDTKVEEKKSPSIKDETTSSQAETSSTSTKDQPKPTEAKPREQEKPKETEATKKEEQPKQQEQPKPVETKASFDINYWISFAKDAAVSKGLTLDSSAVDCWDNPITANPDCIYLERDINSRLNRYAGDEDITDVWIAAIAAGGWVAVVVVVVICLIALIVCSCFGIFFSSEDKNDGSQTMREVVVEINQDYQDKLDAIKSDNPYDELEMSGSRAVWPEVLSVYAVKTTTDPDNPQEVATVTEEKKQLLSDIFWAMNDISYRTKTDTETEIIESDDGHGNILEERKEVTKTTLYITVSHKTADQMSDQYRFNADQDEQLDELLNVDNSMWMAVLYGVYGSDDMIVQVALSQIGNVGGEPYWSWYGFGSRVEWCACFVSWCADQCGYIDTGVIPKYAGCDNGMDWFKERGQWADNSVEPSPGMIIFFDWAYNGQDGTADHTGIVERVENGIVYTVEGNTSDSCAERHYAVGHSEILGYGMPAY